MEENEAKNDIQITEDVVSVIAGIAMKDIEGVAKVKKELRQRCKSRNQ